jgi:predicted enzyme related to lactoylglutathione lyase
MTVSLQNVTFDCAEPAVVAGFWSGALGLTIDPGGNEWIHTIGVNDPAVTPNWFFLKVPEPKAAKNRMHVDLATDDRDKEVQRLVTLGATRLADKHEFGLRWTVMADPEGNEFCVSSGQE